MAKKQTTQTADQISERIQSLRNEIEEGESREADLPDQIGEARADGDDATASRLAVELRDLRDGLEAKRAELAALERRLPERIREEAEPEMARLAREQEQRIEGGAAIIAEVEAKRAKIAEDLDRLETLGRDSRELVSAATRLNRQTGAAIPDALRGRVVPQIELREAIKELAKHKALQRTDHQIDPRPIIVSATGRVN